MYTLHIGNKNYSSWSLRPWILLRELAIPFTERMHLFGAGFERAGDAKSPTGRVPVLHDGERVIWDSLAITEYLAERHPGVWPGDDDARAWARCAAAEMHSSYSALRTYCSMSCGTRMKLKQVPEALREDIARVNAVWSDGLRRFGGPFLAGKSFSAADAFFCPVAFRWQTYGFELAPPAREYAQRLLALPGMKEWYAAALAEPYRDEPHEEEVLQLATVVQDLRAPARASASATS
jgi:glutathione S-transferase